MKHIKKLSLLAVLLAQQVIADEGFPGPGQPSAEVVQFYGRLLFVATSYGSPRALLCDHIKPIPSDYSTCIDLVNADLEGLETMPDCLLVGGAYIGAKEALYLGGVGKEFGLLKVSSFASDIRCRAE